MDIKPKLAGKLEVFAAQQRETRRQSKHAFKDELKKKGTPDRSHILTERNFPKRAMTPARQAPAQFNPPGKTQGMSSKNITVTQANRLAKYAPIIQECSAKYQVPVPLICGVILQESGAKAQAVSKTGAKGLMQLMPATATRFGVSNAFDAKQNIDGGTKYLKFLLDKFEGNYELALAGYNAGEHRVAEYGNKIPPFKETQKYIPNVLSYANTIAEILGPQQSPQVAVNLPSYSKKV